MKMSKKKKIKKKSRLSAKKKKKKKAISEVFFPDGCFQRLSDYRLQGCFPLI